MKTIRLILYFVVIALAFFLAWYAIDRITNADIFPFSFGKKDKNIENTPVIVQEMKQISQLLTQSFYDECIIDSIKTEKIPNAILLKHSNPVFSIGGLYLNNLGYMNYTKRYILIASGTVKAGFDLEKLTDTSIVTNQKESITIYLPKPEILDVIINPSGYQTFEEQGIWTFEERKAVQKKALTILEQNALKKGILKKSKKQGIQILTVFFKSLGFKKVTIKYLKYKKIDNANMEIY